MDSDSIAFFDVETTVPSRPGQGYSLLEFGAILVCPYRLVELAAYSTLIRPPYVSYISPTSVRCNGITPDTVAGAPTFADVADRVYSILHGKVWAGHNIINFDCRRIKEAFAEIGRPAPEPRGTIDSLPLLRQKFGKRAGNMKMASLAAYFGLGQQKHRSLDDVRMNLEVIKHCAAVLLLESSVVGLSEFNCWTSPEAVGIETAANFSAEIPGQSLNPASDLHSTNQKGFASMDKMAADSCVTGESSKLKSEMDNLVPCVEEMQLTSTDIDLDCNERFTADVQDFTSPEDASTSTAFLHPGEISKAHISVTLVSINQYGRRMLLLHRGVALQLYCTELRVHFGVSPKFLDHAGRPKLSMALGAPASLCQVLDGCENIGQQSMFSSGSRSEWRALIKKNWLSSDPIVRLNIPTLVDGDTTVCLTEVYQKDTDGNIKKLDLNNSYVEKLESLIVPGTILDTYFGIELYDYRLSAGIRLVAKRLVIHS